MVTIINILEPEPEPVPEIRCDDLFMVVRPILIFGKFTGIFPLMGLTKMNENFLPRFAKPSWISIVTLSIMVAHALETILLFAVTLKWIWEKRDNQGIQEFKQLHFPIEGAGEMWIVWLYWSLWTNSDKLCGLFSNWRKYFSKMHWIPQDDTSLKWKSRFLMIALMTSAILENIVNSTRYISVVRKPTEAEQNMTMSEIYYRRENGALINILPYNMITFIVISTLHKTAVYSINLVSILIFIMAYSLGQKFRSFVGEIDGRLEESGGMVEPDAETDPNPYQKKIKVRGKPCNVNWTLMRHDYLILCQLVQNIDEFLSPLIFIQVGFAVQWICITICACLAASSESLLDQIYSVWAVGHLTARILILILAASEICEQPHKLRATLEKCSTNEYCLQVERLERLVSHPMGLTGLRCFTLSRSFILSLFNVIFTIVIVMLQSSVGNVTNSKQSSQS